MQLKASIDCSPRNFDPNSGARRSKLLFQGYGLFLSRSQLSAEFVCEAHFWRSGGAAADSLSLSFGTFFLPLLLELPTTVPVLLRNLGADFDPPFDDDSVLCGSFSFPASLIVAGARYDTRVGSVGWTDRPSRL